MVKLRRRHSIRGLVGLKVLIGLAFGLLGVTPAGYVASLGIVAIYLAEEMTFLELLVMVSILGVSIGLTLPYFSIPRYRSMYPRPPKPPPAALQLVEGLLTEPPRSAITVGSSLTWAVAEFSPEMIEAIGGDLGRL